MGKKINTVEKAVEWAEKQAAKSTTQKERKDYVEDQELGGDELRKPIDPYPEPEKPNMTHEVEAHPPAIFTNKVGRPTLYCGENTCNTVKLLASKGFTDIEMSQALNICEATFNNWKLEHPEFVESIKSGKGLIDEMVQKSLLGRALGCTIKEVKAFCYEGEVVTEVIDKHIVPDVAAQIFWLKNRKPKAWRDKVDFDLTVPFNINMEEKDVNTL
jgi:hypothetical protein